MHFLILLTPVLVNAHISIKIIASTSESLAAVQYSGSDVSVISDKERDTFQLSDSNLKSAAKKYFGRWPNDAYVKSPTPWDDLYRSYGWQQVTRTLYPTKARIIGIHKQPVIVSTQEFTNNSTNVVKFNAGISQFVEDTVSNSWRKGGEFNVGQSISYSIEFAKIGMSGTTSLSYTSQWGEESSKSKSITVGSSTGMEVALQPYKVAQSILSATKGSMEVEVEYVARLEGSVACHYAGTYRGHYFWQHDINNLLSAGNLPREIVSREILKVGFYSDVKVTVTD